MRPIALSPNRPRQFYRGGSALDAFRGIPAEDDHRPEDWIGSTTRRQGTTSGAGLTTLEDGSLLRDAMLADPVAWLGPEHAAALGALPSLLVKLLDAGERLPVHVHPGRDFARRHLGSRYGKTEAWLVLEAHGAEARVHLGFVRDVAGDELDRWMAESDAPALLANLHALDVAPGDTILVPAGMPHAIGPGIFCLELQEPTDFSIMLESRDFDELDPGAGRLGLELEMARECVERNAVTAERLAALRGHDSASRDSVERLFPEDADAFFRAERIRSEHGPVNLEPDFAVLVVLDGEGLLSDEGGGALELRRGSAVLIPFAAGETALSGSLLAVRCRPPTSGPKELA